MARPSGNPPIMEYFPSPYHRRRVNEIKAERRGTKTDAINWALEVSGPDKVSFNVTLPREVARMAELLAEYFEYPSAVAWFEHSITESVKENGRILEQQKKGRRK